MEEDVEMPYAVRSAEPRDLAGVASLLAPHSAPAELKAAWDQAMSTANITVYVAESAEDVVGLFRWQTSRH